MDSNLSSAGLAAADFVLAAFSGLQDILPALDAACDVMIDTMARVKAEGRDVELSDADGAKMTIALATIATQLPRAIEAISGAGDAIRLIAKEVGAEVP